MEPFYFLNYDPRFLRPFGIVGEHQFAHLLDVGGKLIHFLEPRNVDCQSCRPQKTTEIDHPQSLYHICQITVVDRGELIAQGWLHNSGSGASAPRRSPRFLPR